MTLRVLWWLSLTGCLIVAPSFVSWRPGASSNVSSRATSFFGTGTSTVRALRFVVLAIRVRTVRGHPWLLVSWRPLRERRRLYFELPLCPAPTYCVYSRAWFSITDGGTVEGVFK